MPTNIFNPNTTIATPEMYLSVVDIDTTYNSFNTTSQSVEPGSGVYIG